jgi:lysyl-tRNA synthetase class II
VEEVANAYSVKRPIDQRERFEEQMRLSEKEMMKQTELLMKIS